MTIRQTVNMKTAFIPFLLILLVSAFMTSYSYAEDLSCEDYKNENTGICFCRPYFGKHNKACTCPQDISIAKDNKLYVHSRKYWDIYDILK